MGRIWSVLPPETCSAWACNALVWDWKSATAEAYPRAKSDGAEVLVLVRTGRMEYSATMASTTVIAATAGNSRSRRPIVGRCSENADTDTVPPMNGAPPDGRSAHVVVGLQRCQRMSRSLVPTSGSGG